MVDSRALKTVDWSERKMAGHSDSMKVAKKVAPMESQTADP
jgi:hypothetical protein